MIGLFVGRKCGVVILVVEVVRVIVIVAMVVMNLVIMILMKSCCIYHNGCVNSFNLCPWLTHPIESLKTQ